jgi:hypothetical protein
MENGLNNTLLLCLKTMNREDEHKYTVLLTLKALSHSG